MYSGENEIQTPYTGGDYTFEYTIENAEDRRVYADPDCSWIDVRNSIVSSFVIHIEPSDGTPRAGQVVLTYPDAEKVTITVNQLAKGSLAESVGIDVVDITYESAKVLFTNPNQSHWICPIIQTKKYYDQQIAPDPKAWVDAYVHQMYTQWKDYCNKQSKQILFEDYWGISNKDGANKSFPNLTVETPYVVVGLEIDPFRNYTGAFIVKEFSSAAYPPVEKVDLTFTVSVTYDPSLSSNPYTLTVVPSNKTVQYYLDADSKSTVAGYISRYGGLKEYVSDYLANYYQYAPKFQGDAVIKRDIWTDYPVPPTVKVTIFGSGCDKFKRITSEVMRKDFTIDTTVKSTQTL